MSRKYIPLQTYLKAQSGQEITMTFKEIEKILGIKLPASARRYPAWWSNHPSQRMASVWLPTGYRSAQVDMQGERLVFRRERGFGVDLSGFALSDSVQDSVQDSGAAGHGYAFKVYGCMKGVITIADGVDLTEPADPDWRARAADEDD
ncbi:MAG: DUF7662 domain-containing protein [bacterium]